MGEGLCPENVRAKREITHRYALAFSGHSPSPTHPSFTMKQFLSAADVPDINALIAKARAHKAKPFGSNHLGQQKMVINLFFNASLRTRMSTEKAARQLGYDVITYDASGGWGIEFEDGTVMNGNTAEHVREAAGVLSQYCDILCVRSFPTLTDKDADYEDRIIKAFVKYASVPVVSMESATRHPLQSLTDCLTISEHRTTARPKVVLTWAPHPRRLPRRKPSPEQTSSTPKTGLPTRTTAPLETFPTGRWTKPKWPLLTMLTSCTVSPYAAMS